MTQALPGRHEWRLPRAMHRWFPAYLRSLCRRPPAGIPDLLICLADHFEPRGCSILQDGAITGGMQPRAAAAFTSDWCRRYTTAMAPFRDVDGYPPRHTFFYPWEEYDAIIADPLAAFRAAGLGEIELHLHHRNDTSDGLRVKLESARKCLRDRHGLLGQTATGETAFAFVHGNWALCDGRPDGDWCGVRDEIAVLTAAGCYADLTFPSAPSPSQPRLANRLVFAADPQGRRFGVQPGPSVGSVTAANRIMLISGPLGLNFRRRKAGFLPRLENAELSAANPPTAARLKLWMRLAARVPGNPGWMVLKLHTHGARAQNRDLLTGAAMADFHRLLDDGAKAGHWHHHYVTARELYNIIRAGSSGLGGRPGDWRDHYIRANG